MNVRVRSSRASEKISRPPCSTITPASMNTLTSPTSRAKPISWVTTTIVMPDSATSRITASTSPTSSGSSADVGSSNSSTFGSITSARAMATRCCWPPESWLGYLPMWSMSPTRLRPFAARCSASSRATPFTRRSAIVTFSSAHRWGKRLNCWKTMPTCFRSSVAWRPGAYERPSSVTVPAVGFSRRLMVRSSVDLPEPDGPKTTTCCPDRTLRSMPFRTSWAPKDLWMPRSSTIARVGPSAPAPFTVMPRGGCASTRS